MEIFLIKSGYHNEYHVENLASIFLIFTPTCSQVEILVAIRLHDSSKKIAAAHVFGALCINFRERAMLLRRGRRLASSFHGAWSSARVLEPTLFVNSEFRG
jgi:hypothetical protein